MRLPEPPYNQDMVQRDRAKKAANQPAAMARRCRRSLPVNEGYYSGLELPEGVTGDVFGDPTQPGPVVAPQSQDEVEMVRRATEVLGINHVARWMRSKIPSLDNQTPYALMQTEDGRRQVERVLLKIQHGVY